MVVDDEAMARERVVAMLRQEQDIELIGECSDGQQAVGAINSQHPDLVFLDVQMPACDGFGVIEQIGPERMPAVVFVTAYDEYALRAFEVHALDYLLKPFGRERFQQTLQHARTHVDRSRAGDLGKRLMALVQDVKPEPQRLDRLVVKSGGRVFFLRTEDIVWIEAAGNYVRLHLGDDSHLFRETMNGVEVRLDPRRFVRIHRSRIVNSDRIKELQPWFNGEYVVVLQNGTRLTLSRGYREKLQERLGKNFCPSSERPPGTAGPGAVSACDTGASRCRTRLHRHGACRRTPYPPPYMTKGRTASAARPFVSSEAWSYQSNFTPNFAIRGPSTVVARSNDEPPRQLVLTAVFEFMTLKRSANTAARALLPKRIRFSARMSTTDTVS